MFAAHGLRAHGTRAAAILRRPTVSETPDTVAPFAAVPALPRFYALTVTTFRPGGTVVTRTRGWGSRPHGALSQAPIALSSSGEIRASDMGYRTAPTDSGGVQVYPPILDTAFEIDREVNIDPGSGGVSAAWGAARMLNRDGALDAVVAAENIDRRPVRILYGYKQRDLARGIYTDPRRSSLAVLFAGLALPWSVDESGVEVPLRDASLWLDRPLQSQLYLGTGGYEGPAELKGRPKPKARGGTPSTPILNITPVLIDATNRIWQYNDGPGTVVKLYEKGGDVFVNAGNTADLYSGSTPSGQYRTDNSRGLFQLGAPHQGQITADVTGAFPGGTAASGGANIARLLMLEDGGLPEGYIEAESFTALDATYSNQMGWYWSEPTTVGDAVRLFLRGLNARLIPLRTGALRAWAVRPVSSGAKPIASYDVSSLGRLSALRLPTALDPPPWRYRVGYNCNHTPQTSDLAGVLDGDEARKLFLRERWRFAAWADSSVAAAYQQPNEPDPIETPHLSEAGAQAIADELGAAWGTRRRLYAAPAPFGLVLQQEIGDVVRVDYPVPGLRGGGLAVVVGDSLRGADGSAFLRLLV